MTQLDDTLAEIFFRLESDPSLYAKGLADLQPRIGSNRVDLLCPNCHGGKDSQSGKLTAWLKPGSRTIACNRENNCGAESSVLGRVIGINDRPAGASIFEACNIWADITGVPRITRSKEQQQQHEQYQKTRNAIETIWQVCNDAIRDPLANTPGHDYLAHRGFTDSFCGDNFGYLAEPSSLSVVVDSDALQQLGLLFSNGDYNPKWRNCIVVPGKTAAGKIVGLIRRRIEEDDTAKYINIAGYAPAQTAGLGIDLARKFKRAVIAEGPLDMLKARQEGIFNVIAAGTASYSAANLNQLALYGVREVVSALDADPAGSKGTLALLDAADNNTDIPEVYVIDLPGNCHALQCSRHCKDVDEFITAHGADAFNIVVENAPHGLQYRARQMAAGYDFTASGTLVKYVEECLKFNFELKDRLVQLRAREHFLPEVSRISGNSLPELKEIVDEHHAKQAKEAKIAASGDALSAATTAIAAGEISRAQSEILKASELLRPDKVGYESTISMGADIIQSVEAKLRKYASREFIGLKNQTLPTLDRALHGLRGFILLAGPTNIGKTILLTQLASDVVRYNSDCCVLFLTLEMHRDTIIQRMWTHLAGTDWFGLKEAYGPNPNGTADKVAIGRDEFDQIRKYIKFWFPRIERDTTVSEQNIIAEVEHLIKATGRSRCMVIVDYFDVFPAPAGCERMPRIEVENVLCDTFLNISNHIGEDNPLFVVSALRKLKGQERADGYSTDDILGSGRKAYSTDVDILWDRWSDKQLYSRWRTEGTFLFPEDREAPGGPQWKAREIQDEVKAIKNILADKGISYGYMDVTKVRDGGVKLGFDVTVYYSQNRIIEGIHE